MWYETINTAPNPDVTLSKTYYVYAYDSTDERRAGKSDGNVTRIILVLSPEGTEHVSAGSANSVVERGLRGGACPEPRRDRSARKLRDAQDERAGDWSAGSTAAACGAGETRYTAIRLGYAANGRAVTFVHDESWCTVAGQTTCAPATTNQYAVAWAREFRYDGARARYMNRKLDPAGLLVYPPVYTALSTTWSDYDGDETYGDFEVVSGSPVNKRSFEPGIARTENPLTTPVTNYYHGDILGTTRMMSNPSGSSIEPAVYTAFGERITGPTTTDASRYGYVGAWGYQQHADFPFLHVGARYYDPSSGRFLQRDPIGIRGALNVYEYVENSPLQAVDPLGLCHFCDMKVSPTDGGKIDWTSGEVGATVSKLLGMLWCHVITDNPDWGRPPPPEPKPPTEAKPPYIPGPPAPGYCFVAGTGVLTPDGPVRIEDIEVGTIVVAHDGPCGDAVERPVIRVFRGETTELVTVTFGTESVICTRPHPFYVVDRGWVEAGDLHEGDLVPTATGEPMEISSVTIRALSAPVPVYNFHVEQHHYYFVGDGRFLVHNGKM
jgi:RHS repeat-associated protein